MIYLGVCLIMGGPILGGLSVAFHFNQPQKVATFRLKEASPPDVSDMGLGTKNVDPGVISACSSIWGHPKNNQPTRFNRGCP